MVVVNGRFDGKVLIPDEPLDEAAGQRFRIVLEPEESAATEEAAKKQRVNFHDLIGLAKQPGQKPYDPDEEDELYEYLERQMDEDARSKPTTAEGQQA